VLNNSGYIDLLRTEAFTGRRWCERTADPVPEDVARCTVLCHPATDWTAGNTLPVDGGENVVG
jgi:hypothetical protein